MGIKNIKSAIINQARKYLLKDHSSPLTNILHQCSLQVEMQYHRDIETAYQEGAKWGMEQGDREQKRMNEVIIEWLETNVKDYVFDFEGNRAFIDMPSFIEDIRKFLKNEKGIN